MFFCFFEFRKNKQNIQKKSQKRKYFENCVLFWISKKSKYSKYNELLPKVSLNLFFGDFIIFLNILNIFEFQKIQNIQKN